VNNLIVKLLPQTFFKIGERGFIGNVFVADAGVKTRVSSPFLVT
jgi:hypothetical protein